MHTFHKPNPEHISTLFNGCKMAYTDVGHGEETLLFIHGLGAFGQTWHKNTEVLKKNFRCIAIDLPGNGHSSTGNYAYTMAFFAECIIDFIGRKGLKNVTLVGHSMGGQIALTAALMMPECCDKLILCSPAGFEKFSTHERMMYEASLKYLSLFTSNRHAIQHLVHTSFYHFPKDAHRLESELIKIMEHQPATHYKSMTDKCIAAMFAEPVFEKLPKINQPTLIFFGEKDALIPNTLFHPTTPQKIAEAGQKAMPNAQLILQKKCGHFVQWECAQEVNQHISDWMLLSPQST